MHIRLLMKVALPMTPSGALMTWAELPAPGRCSIGSLADAASTTIGILQGEAPGSSYNLGRL